MKNTILILLVFIVTLVIRYDQYFGDHSESELSIDMTFVNALKTKYPLTARRKIVHKNNRAFNTVHGVALMDSSNAILRNCKSFNDDFSASEVLDVFVPKGSLWSICESFGIKDSKNNQTLNYPDSLSIFNFESKHWKHYTNFYQSKPVIITNLSKKPLKVTREDHLLMMIQEAKDPDGQWRPIEHWIHSWCGNSYWVQDLPARSVLVASVPYYDGDFATQLRIKIKNGDIISYSNAYEGNINLEQFNYQPTMSRILRKTNHSFLKD